MRIGLIPYGWSDGFPRRMPERAEVLVRGTAGAAVGAFAFRAVAGGSDGRAGGSALGDEVVLLGRSGGEEITLAELAGQWGLAPGELPPMIGRTLRRVYLRR